MCEGKTRLIRNEALTAAPVTNWFCSNDRSRLRTTTGIS